MQVVAGLGAQRRVEGAGQQLLHLGRGLQQGGQVVEAGQLGLDATDLHVQTVVGRLAQAVQPDAQRQGVGAPGGQRHQGEHGQRGAQAGAPGAGRQE